MVQWQGLVVALYTSGRVCVGGSGLGDCRSEVLLSVTFPVVRVRRRDQGEGVSMFIDFELRVGKPESLTVLRVDWIKDQGFYK